MARLSALQPLIPVPPCAVRSVPLRRSKGVNSSSEAHDRVSCGIGWGHVPRPITECCVAAQGSIDDLVLRVQHHDRTYNVPLCRLHDANAAHWGCHSVGVVNVCRSGACAPLVRARQVVLHMMKMRLGRMLFKLEILDKDL